MRDEVSGRFLRWLPGIVYVLGLASFLLDSQVWFDFPLDDAWIHAVYARSLAWGHGFAFNEGLQEAGSTSPLWAILTAPAYWFEGAGTDLVVVLVKLFGIALGCAILLGVARLLKVLSGSADLGALGAAIIACEPRFLFAVLSGMEPLLLVALWVWGMVAVMEGNPLIALSLFGLCPVTRPEAIMLFPFAWKPLWELWNNLPIKADEAVEEPPGEKSWLKALFGVLLLLGPTIIWISFCLSVTGHPFPNTYYVKASPFRLDLERVILAWKCLTDQGFASLAIFPAFLLLFPFGRRNLKPAETPAIFGLLLGAPLAFLLAVVGTRRIVLEGYYWTRWIDPAALVLTVPFAGVLASTLLALFGGGEKQGAGRPGRFLAIILVPGVLVGIPTFARSFSERRLRCASDSRCIALLNVGAGNWVRENTPEAAIVAVNDAGAIRYFGDRRTIDLGGLNHADLAFGKTTIDSQIRKADWLVIFPEAFRRTPFWEEIRSGFIPRCEIKVPPDEYTVTGSSFQSVIWVLQRRSP